MECIIRCQDQIFGPIKMVLFDKDGTLAHSAPYLYQLGRSRTRFVDAQIPGVGDPLLMAFGFDDENRLNPQGLLAVSSRQESTIAAATYIAETGRGWVESLEIAKAAFEEADGTMPPKAETTTIIGGVTELVRSLHQAQIRLGIISSDITKNVVDFAHQYELANFFEYLVGADTVDKADPDACKAFFQDDSLKGHHILVIGDTASDMRLAQSLGASAIGVTWGWDVPYTIEGAGAIATQPSDIQLVRE